MMVRITTDQFIRNARSIHGDRYNYSHVEYQGRFSKIEIICHKHGSFFQTPGNHLCGKGCRLCKNEKLSKDRAFSTQDFINKSITVHHGRYDYSNAIYINAHSPLKICCPLHGAFFQAPANHLKGIGCLKCGKLKAKKKLSSNVEEFIKKAVKIHGDQYNYIFVNYKNASTKIKIHCSIHGVFHQSPNKHLAGQGCPQCASSLGEKKIEKYLEEKEIAFIPKKIFKNCRAIRPLPFDFFLPELNTAIEYDGKQHFAIVNFTGIIKKEVLQKQFEKVQVYDQLKTEYCKRNGIRLIRIPYTQFNNIQKVLESHLKEGKNAQLCSN